MPKRPSAPKLIALALALSLFANPLARYALADKPAPPDDKAPQAQESAPASAEGEGAPQPVRATLFVMAHPGVDDQVLIPAIRAIDDGLKRNPRLEMKDLDTRLADFAQEVPQDQIDEARALLADGHKALTALELPAAQKKLGQAVEALAKVLPFVKKQELADAMMALAATLFELGDRRAARATLARLFVWRPDFRLDTSRYPPSLIGPVEEARKETERAKRGSLDVRSEPTAAQVYVDGKYIGVTPTFAEGLTVGEHWVTFKREGFRKAVTPATVSAKQQQIVNITLERSRKYLLVEQALAKVEKTLGQEFLDASADNLKEVLFVDHAVFVRAAMGASGNIELDTYLYDLRTRHRLTHVQKTVAAAGAEKQVKPLASELYTNVSYDAELEAPKDAPPPKTKVRQKFYKTWWFWTVAGAVVAGVVVGATLAAKPKDCGSGNFCPGFSF